MTPSPNTYPATSLEVDGYIATILCPPGITAFKARPAAHRDATAALVTSHGEPGHRSAGTRLTNGTTGVTTPGNREEVRIVRSPRETTAGGTSRGGPGRVPPGRFVSTRTRPPGTGPRMHDGATRPRARAVKGSPGERTTSPARPCTRPARRRPRSGGGLGAPTGVPITRRFRSGAGRSRRRAVSKGNSRAYGTHGTRSCRYLPSMARFGRSPGSLISSREERGEGAMPLWKPPPTGSMVPKRSPTPAASVTTRSGSGSSRMPGSDRPGSTSCASMEVSAPCSFRVLVRAFADRRAEATGSDGSGPRGPVGAPRAPPAGWAALAGLRLGRMSGAWSTGTGGGTGPKGCRPRVSMSSGIPSGANETLIRSFRHRPRKRSMRARGDETAPTQCA